MVELIAVDGFQVSISGDCRETLLWVDDNGQAIVEKPRELLEADEILLHHSAHGQTEAEVLAKMVDIVCILRRSIQQGIAGTRYADRIRGQQSGAFQAKMDTGQLPAAGVLNRAVLDVTALMEVKTPRGRPRDG
jgi:hypothetical protein